MQLQLRSRRRGRERIWELEPARLSDAHEYLIQIERQWADALDRLKRFVEGRTYSARLIKGE